MRRSANLVLGFLLGGMSPAVLGAQTGELGGDLQRGPWHVAFGLVDSLADSVSVPAAIRGSLTLGNTARAGSLLARYGDLLDAGARLELVGAVAAARGEWGPAAKAFGTAAAARPDSARGRLDVRAALAYQAAGVRDSAVAAYRRARARLPQVAGWLALREAMLVQHPALAESLLHTVPAVAWPLALRARARLRLLDGDAAGAEELLEAAGLPGEAAELALARGDSTAAARYAIAAMLTSDTADVRRGLVLFQEAIDPPSAAAALAAARGASRVREVRQAATWGLRAVTLGDSSPATLLTVGGWLEAGGRRRASLELYELAGADGELPHARARLRLGDRRAIAALRRFADEHPDDPDAPAALMLVASVQPSDSLLAEVARRWPLSVHASRARMRLALRRLAAGDSLAAVPFLDGEVLNRGGAEAHARFLRARIRETQGRDSIARVEFAVLAAVDSLGYYGTLARREVGLPAPRMPGPPPRIPDSTVTAQLGQLALLDSLGLSAEADLVVRSFFDRTWDDVEAMLDAADGLTRLGRANLAIRLGYAASRQRGLNDPRVLRVVFPWPDRDLVRAEAEAFGLDPFLVAGLIRQESWFLPIARSRAGAVGYMQLMPATARDVARRARLPWSDPMLTVTDANLHLGCRHLAALLRTYGGDVVPALAAYNAGGTPVRRWRRHPGAADPAGFVEQITYPETQAYVQAVVRNAALYEWLYGEEAADGVP